MAGVERLICGTELSVDEVEKALREEFRTESRLVDWGAEEVGKGQGFVSCLARVTLHWNPPDPTLPSSVLVKIPSTRNIEEITQMTESSNLSAEFVENLKSSLKKLHNCEVAAYELFKDGRECPVSMVKVFKSKRIGEEGQAYILMEDLTQEAGCKDMVTGLTFQQLKQVYEQIGALQAWSLKNRHWRKAELSMNIMEVMAANDTKMEADMQKFLEEVKQPEWVERLGQRLVDNVHKLQMTSGEMQELVFVHRLLGIPDVLVHGDFWSNNFLIRKDAAGEPNGDLLAIIDWQISHPGSPAEDFGRLMSSSVNHEIRRNHEKDLLEHYYASLERHLGGPAPFSMDQFMKHYESLLVMNAALVVPMMPVVVKSIEQGFLKNLDPVKGAESMIANMRALLEDSLEIVEKRA